MILLQCGLVWKSIRDEHRQDPLRAGYRFKVVQTGLLTVEEARLSENLIIHAYSFVKAVENRRREIAVYNLSGFDKYIETAIELYTTVAEDEAWNLMEYTPFNKGPRRW